MIDFYLFNTNGQKKKMKYVYYNNFIRDSFSLMMIPSLKTVDFT